MNGPIQLSAGVVAAMFKGELWKKPIVQVIDIKKIQGPNGQMTQPERFRLVVSDGLHFQQAMVATQLNNLIQSQTITNRCIVRLDEYICNTVQGRRIVIILNLVQVAPPQPTIGNPQTLEVTSSTQQDQSGSSQPQRVQPQGGSIVKQQNIQQVTFGGQEGIIPIKALNPYQNRWTIKARVTAKSEKRTFHNNKGPGQLFTVDLLDSLGGEIRATFFGDAVDYHFPNVEIGGVYLISKGHVKYANKKFSNLKNDYEITLDKSAIVQRCEEDESIKSNQYHFVDIADLPDHQKDEVLDVIGVILDPGALDTITTKSGSDISKRVVHLGDQSGARVELTVWGDKALEQDLQQSAILVAKGVKVSNFNTCSLTALRTSVLETDPRVLQSLPQAEKLRQWWEEQGHALDLNPISVARDFGHKGDGQKRVYNTARITFAQIKSEGLGLTKAQYFTVRGTITVIKHDVENPPWYKACPSAGCGKKVTPVSGQYVCTECGEQASYIPRYVLSLTANDHTGSYWLTAFNEVATDILGKEAIELLQLLQSSEAEYEQVFKDALFKTFLLRIRAAEHKWADEVRVKCNVVKVSAIHPAEESRYLIAQIQRYLAQ